jgi:hypothetical protein
MYFNNLIFFKNGNLVNKRLYLTEKTKSVRMLLKLEKRKKETNIIFRNLRELKVDETSII